MKYFSLPDISKELNIVLPEISEQILLNSKVINHPSFEEIKLFLSIQNNETEVFNGWIEQNQSLKSLLTSGTTTEFFIDNHNWNQHAFFIKFKTYVSPFFKLLEERKTTVEISNEWPKIFSFFCLMDDDTRFYIEQLLYANIKKSIDQKLIEAQNDISEADFHQILLFLLSDNSIRIHNSLSRASHALKVNFIERILQLFYHPRCSAKLAHWMILSLEKMELNFEQNDSLKVIKNKIKKGEIAFSNEANKKNPIRIKNLIFILVGFITISLCLYFYNQDPTINYTKFKESSSLEYFSIEERKEIDSLLKSMSIEANDSLNEVYVTTGNIISVQTPIVNDLARNIYSELEQDMSNHFLRVYDTCTECSTNKLKDEKITKTFSLSEINSKNELEIKNDSDYSFLILVWNETKQGKVFSGFFNKKSVFKMKIDEGMRLIFIPGITYGEIPDKLKSDFRLLTKHFCSIDFNYEFSLQKIQSVRPSKNKESKILLEGTLGEVIILTDSNGILE